MSPHLFLGRVVEPGLALLPVYMTSDAARVMLMAIAGQESNWSSRAQDGGPALGYFQFEAAGVNAVLTQTSSLALSVMATSDVPPTLAPQAIEYNDPLACAFARLLLWHDPAPLPSVSDAAGAWAYYVRNWKPGKPDQTRWAQAHATAVSVVSAGV